MKDSITLGTGNNTIGQLILLFAGFTVAFILIAEYNYLLFHTSVELFSIIVSTMIFTVMWNTRIHIENGYLLFIGIAYLFVGLTDLLHALSYKGMGIFNDRGANLPTQTWIAARYIESISLVAGFFFIKRRFNLNLMYFIGSIVFIALVFSLLVFNNFPDCFIEGQGLTPFKKYSEYLISTLIATAGFLLYRNRESFSPFVFQLLIASLVAKILSELVFTLYLGVYDSLNFSGHILKFISVFLIYRAIVNTGLKNPYNLLVRNLNQSRTDLEKERDELKHAMEQIKQLEGLLPICSSCKKIRDDKGYWNQIETYVMQHANVNFTHGICPDCSQKLYPDIDISELDD
jgi:hypothetical protein